MKAGKNTTAEEYAKRITKDNGWTRATSESIWIGQERGFRINEGKRCYVKITIRLKGEQALPKLSKESTKMV